MPRLLEPSALGLDLIKGGGPQGAGSGPWIAEQFDGLIETGVGTVK